MKESRKLSFLVIFLIYIIALLIGLFVFKLDLSSKFLLNVLYADIVATIFIFLVGVLLSNASVYDPYWSVAPIVILPLAALYYNNFSIGVILLLVVIMYWGIRLTLNWAYTFNNLNHQDWRYTMLKEKSKKFYPIVNFMGINMFPTIIVYLAILPALIYISDSSFNIFSVIGLVICLIATTVQLISDYQMHQFRKLNKGKKKMIDVGLWSKSRHPNYFGEILMWWGVYVFVLINDPSNWILFIGAFMNNLMFLIISIPMQENRLIERNSDYLEYIKNTNKLIPWI